MRRRRRCCTWTLALLLALLFAGCGRVETVPEDREVPPLETEQEETEEPVPEDPAALTAEEIAQVNEAFAPFDERENGSYMNPVCSFFTSYYERPEDLNLVEFLRYFGLGNGPVEDGPEFEALKAAEGWPFHVDHLDQMPVPIHRYSRADVDAYLEEHAGITTADLTTFPVSSADLLYLPEYDAFYNFTSDAGPGVFICEAGRREGALLILTGGSAELTLEKTEAGRYLFRSFLPLERET
ncbi:hypothetical protein [Oscillibacter sp.]|uniref:hypothetical protein n=1 Tax=Oscillospiraceae TaxID=216572 RepID=UPI00262BB65B|nr:hypothetical protein [Oscillibacter sp.]MBS6353674.1 hypothetical protein [Oscillibacter sp.]